MSFLTCISNAYTNEFKRLNTGTRIALLVCMNTTSHHKQSWIQAGNPAFIKLTGRGLPVSVGPVPNGYGVFVRGQHKVTTATQAEAMAIGLHFRMSKKG